MGECPCCGGQGRLHGGGELVGKERKLFYKQKLGCGTKQGGLGSRCGWSRALRHENQGLLRGRASGGGLERPLEI